MAGDQKSWKARLLLMRSCTRGDQAKRCHGRCLIGKLETRNVESRSDERLFTGGAVRLLRPNPAIATMTANGHNQTFAQMTNSRTELEAAAGKLISAIQKEWHSEAGQPDSAASELVMHSAHDLLQASKSGSLATVIGSGSVSSYLGNQWVQEHPRVVPYIAALEATR